MGARELRDGVPRTSIDLGNAEMAMALTVDQLIDSLAVRVNGPRAWDAVAVIDLELTDEGRTWRLELSNGALIHRSRPTGTPAPGQAAPGLTLTLSKPQLLGVLAGQGLDGVTVTGDGAVLGGLVALLDTPDPDFAIVTP